MRACRARRIQSSLKNPPWVKISFSPSNHDMLSAASVEIDKGDGNSVRKGQRRSTQSCLLRRCSLLQRKIHAKLAKLVSELRATNSKALKQVQLSINVACQESGSCSAGGQDCVINRLWARLWDWLPIYVLHFFSVFNFFFIQTNIF